MRRRTVLSLEQALSLPYATLRFAQLGWRVIRIEAYTPGEALPGDPNRYIGSRVADDDRRSYFVAPNVGKEAIALNLREPGGRAVLQRLLRALDVDIFCCNTLPRRYQAFHRAGLRDSQVSDAAVSRIPPGSSPLAVGLARLP